MLDQFWVGSGVIPMNSGTKGLREILLKHADKIIGEEYIRDSGSCTNAALEEESVFSYEKFIALMKKVERRPPSHIMVGCPFFHGKIQIEGDDWYFISHSEYDHLKRTTFPSPPSLIQNGPVVLFGMRLWVWSGFNPPELQDGLTQFMARAMMILFGAIAILLGVQSVTDNLP